MHAPRQIYASTLSRRDRRRARVRRGRLLQGPAYALVAASAFVGAIVLLAAVLPSLA